MAAQGHMRRQPRRRARQHWALPPPATRTPLQSSMRRLRQASCRSLPVAILAKRGHCLRRHLVPIRQVLLLLNCTCSSSACEIPARAHVHMVPDLTASHSLQCRAARLGTAECPGHAAAAPVAAAASAASTAATAAAGGACWRCRACCSASRPCGPHAGHVREQVQEQLRDVGPHAGRHERAGDGGDAESAVRAGACTAAGPNLPAAAVPAAPAPGLCRAAVRHRVRLRAAGARAHSLLVSLCGNHHVLQCLLNA